MIGFGCFLLTRVHVIDLHVEVLVQLIIQDVVVILGEEYSRGLMFVRDGAKAAHRRLEYKDLGLRAPEHSHSEKRAAIPTLTPFPYQDEELFLASSS